MKSPLRRLGISLGATTGAIVLAATLGSVPAQGDADVSPQSIPPGIPSLADAESQLAGLTVEPEDSSDPYDRDLFPHWRVVDSPCTARQYVLLRDGTDVVTDDNCQPTSGSWYSEFDGETTDEAQDFDIDHLVPLAEAWRSGADSWTTDERADFANDIDAPALWSVSRSSNQEKGDSDPADWMPSREAIHCDYAKAWINVKHEWDLSADSAEHSALEDILATSC